MVTLYSKAHQDPVVSALCSTTKLRATLADYERDIETAETETARKKREVDEDHERTLNQLHYEVKRKVSGAGDLLFGVLDFLMIDRCLMSPLCMSPSGGRPGC